MARFTITYTAFGVIGVEAQSEGQAEEIFYSLPLGEVMRQLAYNTLELEGIFYEDEDL